MTQNLENESSWNISHLVNEYTDGEKYYYVMYNKEINRYLFDAIGIEKDKVKND